LITKKSGGHKINVPDLEKNQQRGVHVFLTYLIQKETADLATSHELVVLEKHTLRFNLQKELLIAFTSKEKKKKALCKL
jgi:hypothetical protein